MSDPTDWTDVLGNLRYGMPTSEKEARALRSPVPEQDTENMPNSQRAMAGQLFQETHPTLAPMVRPWVDAARIAWFGDTPEQQSWATYGANRAQLNQPAKKESSFADLLMRSLMEGD